MSSFLEKIKNKINNSATSWKVRFQDARFSGVSRASASKEILVIKIDSIGDYILFRNFLKSIKESKKFKNYRITLLGNVWYKEFAEAFDRDVVDEFIWVDLHQLKKISTFNSLAKKFHASGFEYVVSPSYSPAIEDVRLLYLCGARNKVFHKGNDLNVKACLREKYTSDAYAIETGHRLDFEFYRYRDFFQKFLNEKPRVTDSRIAIPISDSKTVLICPGANSLLRKWPAPMFAELIDQIHDAYAGYSFFIVGSSSDWETADQIINKCISKNISNQCGKQNLVDLTKLVASCGLFISNDTGPYHIAMALKKKAVCISNGNNYQRFTPYPPELDRQSVTVLSDKVETLMMDAASIAISQSHLSQEKMSDIPVEKVFKAVKKLLP
ncbi:MAG: glycosyltransferase family 9 protein [Bacteroidetes bacterium]|nr:glycosyltransferase family 9 protein [Bacteroidota bacterium]